MLNTIWLADDDEDDCLMFRKALTDLNVNASLTTVPNGVLLLQRLVKTEDILPDMLFLDLNMPIKNGFVSIEEIQRRPKLKTLPIIVLSTLVRSEVIENLYQQGAYGYMWKPTKFENLKVKISKAIALVNEYGTSPPPKSKYIITTE